VGGHAQIRALGPLLCWAVVYADIGTSVYYVPGLLFRSVGTSAATFVLATSLAFVLLAQKYAEIAARYPGGGGVVSVSEEAFGPRMGALGGMLILVDYFLTAAISSVSGFTYLASLVPILQGFELPLAVGGVLLLGVLNWIGIRESAQASATVAMAAFAALLLLIGITVSQMDAADWVELRSAASVAGRIPIADAVTGFAFAWLAFSGLESLAQISPAMRTPRRRTAGIAMLLVVMAILATSPLLTALATILLDPATTNPDAFQSELAFAVGGTGLRLLIVFSASALLLFAANTAVVGTYHVVGALADGEFLPRPLMRRSRKFGTPHFAIGLAVLVPITVLVATKGELTVLGDLYAFGLLGAFVLSSLSLDRVRIAEGRTGGLFWLGLVTTGLVGIAWVTNLFEKPHATLFGGVLTALLLASGLLHRGDVPFVRARRGAKVTTSEAERIAAAGPGAVEILTLPEALDLQPAYAPKTLVCLRGPNQQLLEEAARRVGGGREHDLAVLFVEEVPGLFVPRDTQPSGEAREVLAQAVAWLAGRDLTAVPIWRLAQDSGEAIVQVARELGVNAVLVGTSQRGTLWRLLRGSVLARLVARMPRDVRLVIVG
jgi:amino acid transporter/nucleotide-binding universal stress UspA family protein